MARTQANVSTVRSSSPRTTARRIRWRGSTWTDAGSAPRATLPFNSGATPTRVAEARKKGWLVPSQDAYWFAPVPRPGKIVCIGMNYRDHAGEIGLTVPTAPAIFSSFLELRHRAGRTGRHSVDERAGRLRGGAGRRGSACRASHVSADRAYDHVLGYTAFNDVTARDFQFGDVQWQRGKSCDTFAPMGQTIVTTDEIPDPHALRIKLTVNGAVMQDSNTSQLIFRVPQLIEFITRSTTLEPGDVIATGTPAGVGHGRKPPVYLKAGDVMEVHIEHIGGLGNPIVAEQAELHPLKSPVTGFVKRV